MEMLTFTQGTYGTVYLKEFMIQRDGASYIGLTGRISVFGLGKGDDLNE